MHKERLFSLVYILFELIKVISFILLSAYLFFDSVWGIVMILPYGIFLLYKIKGKFREYIKAKYVFRFKDTLGCIQTALEAGYSIEKAIAAAGRDMRIMYGDGAYMVTELEQMERKLDLSRNIEAVIEEFAQKTEVREIINFSELFTAAKRSGGDLISLVRSAAGVLGEKLEMRREVEGIISANRTECLVMKAMPPAILLYFRIFAPAFLEPLYETAVGRSAMIVLAAVYFAMSEYAEVIVKKVGGNG